MNTQGGGVCAWCISVWGVGGGGGCADCCCIITIALGQRVVAAFVKVLDNRGKTSIFRRRHFSEKCMASGY